MVMYMHVMLFFICLNLGLGFTSIPDTPLYIDNAQTEALQNCFTVSQENMVVYDTSTSSWVKNGDPNNIVGDGETATQQISDLEGYISEFGDPNTYDPVTAAVDASFSTIDFFKGIVLGGFITNAIDSITLTCDFTTSGSPVVDNPVMQYFKVGLNIIFGLMLALFVLYIVTGKSFGL